MTMPRSLSLAFLAPLSTLLLLGCASSPPNPKAAPAGVTEKDSPTGLLGRDKLMIINNGHGNGNRSFGSHDWVGAAEAFSRAYAFNHRDDVALYLLAATAARSGKPDAAFEWLQRLWQSGSSLVPVARSFSGIENDQRFRDADAILRAQLSKQRHASVAFTVSERDLVPEGIAYDPVDGVFFLSSVWKKKIVRVKPGPPGAPAAVEDFVPAGSDGLDAVLGMKVDPEHRRLWVVSAVEPDMKGFVKESFGRSALFAYDLSSRKLVWKIGLPANPPHLFTDLAFDAAGNVYVTDSVSGEVYVLRPGGTELETFVAKGRFFAPNGVAVSGDGRHVYVADAAQGVFNVDAKTGEVEPLDQPPGLFPTGLDGLVLHGRSLIGIMNLVSVGRVSRWQLSADGMALDAGEVLECGHPLFRVPARGVVVADSLYFIANSQADVIEAGALSLAKLVDIAILKVPL